MYKGQSPGKSSLLLLGKKAGKPAENFRSKLRVTVSVVTTTSTVGGNDGTGHDLRDYWGTIVEFQKVIFTSMTKMHYIYLLPIQSNVTLLN